MPWEKENFCVYFVLPALKKIQTYTCISMREKRKETAREIVD